MKDQLCRAEGDSIDDVSTVVVSLRCLAHIGCGQGSTACRVRSQPIKAVKLGHSNQTAFLAV